MLADRQTRQALQHLHRVSARGREQPVAGNQQQAQERAAAGRARQRLLDRLPDFLEQLEAGAQANGIRVHWAEGPQAANRIVIETLIAAGSREALRNHAPLLDEIALDRAAAANAIRLTRLHPGDHIIDLADDAPSHPVWPTAHLRVEEIGAALQASMRLPATLDPDLLASTVRMPLRRTLLRTHTAILGLHFAVADSGSLVALDNDGHNASLVALARHLICLLSIEQVAADSADLDLLVQAFARSAWGRALPAYITQVSRPAPPEIDGPRFIHLILVDNGRSRIRDAGFGEALRCIGCGACHNACPVFQQIGGRGYNGSAHTGPIGAVINPILLRPGLADRQPYLSSGCDACRPACPVDIDLPGLLQKQRQVVSASSVSWREKAAFWLWQHLLTRPSLFIPAMKLTRRLRRPWHQRPR